MHSDYFLGCPVWACEHWRGTLFRSSAKRSDWLREYSTVFNAVEGNSTFYGLPSDASVDRWADDSPDGFHFVLKFPRTVTHDVQLRGFPPDVRRFLRILEILARSDNVGPAMLQLPPSFAPTELSVLRRFLGRLPSEFQYAVEVRHPDFFDVQHHADALNGLLEEFGADRVTFDSRALHSRPPSDDVERVSQQRKPHLPVSYQCESRRPILRFIGRNDVGTLGPWIDQWAPVIGRWISEGRQPYVFTHTPDDQFAPAMATMFHEALKSELREQWRALPRFPGAVDVRQRGLW